MVKTLAVYFFLKTTSLGRSLWLLAGHGNPIAASIVARSIAEADIQLRFVFYEGLRTAELRAEEFFTYLRFRKREELQRLLETAIKDGDTDWAKKLKKTLKSVKAEFKNRKHTDYWPHRKIDDLAKCVGYSFYHKGVYSPLSGYVHDSFDLFMYIRNQNPAAWETGRSTKDLDHRIIVFCEAYAHITEVLYGVHWNRSFQTHDRFQDAITEMKRLSLRDRGRSD